MKHFSGYGAYLLFLALRTHFTKVKYDFFTMNGKLRANKESYQKRNDKAFFEKIAKLYNAEELKNYYVANLLEDRHYITDMLEDSAHESYWEYEKRRQSLAYTFKNDMDRLFEHGGESAFAVGDGDYPPLIGMVMRRSIALESAVILGDFVPYMQKFDKYLGDDDIIWSRIALKLRKYRPFIQYDSKRFKAILKEALNEDSGRKCI